MSEENSVKAWSCDSRGEAWLNAVRYLVDSGEERSDGWVDYNLVLEITKPGKACPLNRQVEECIDELLLETDDQPIHTVAETIFPATEYKTYGAHGVYEIYPEEIYPKINGIRGNRQGTYILRLVRRQMLDGQPYNPLKHVIKKLKREANSGSRKRAIFELDATNSEALPVYDAQRDYKQYMGDQCLSHLSLKLSPSNALYMTALYRSQYFIKKAVGNFLGLARLQDFIAREAGLSVGPLVCHATYATLESVGYGKKRIREVLNAFPPNS